MNGNIVHTNTANSHTMNTAHKEHTDPMNDPVATHPVLRTVRQALGSLVARLYLAVCAALLVWAIVVSYGDNPDASFAGVVPTIATAPVSLVMLALPDHFSMFFLPVIVGALVNAVIIGWCARALRQGRNG
ncbi:SCO4225 family membrane protein [Streptomyces sp. NPDC053560]|uniref:SCO4225 family membrane protein n=1 Tax=Streptomyces sp. NPDC053560 TaxID=3365711 RepID=UPI0037D6A95F